MSDPLSTPAPIVGRTDDRTMPAVTYALYLLGFASGGLTTLIGLILAYANRGGAGPMAESHYIFLIRTFWIGMLWAVIGVILMVVGIPLSLVLIGIPLVMLAKLILGLVAIWFAVRGILGAIHLARGEAYPRPRAWLL